LDPEHLPLRVGRVAVRSRGAGEMSKVFRLAAVVWVGVVVAQQQPPRRSRAPCTKKRAARGLCVMPAPPLLSTAKTLGSLNAIGFGISLATGSHVHLDLIGTGAFTVAAATTPGRNVRSVLSSCLIGTWATRLASFLFYRATKTGHDGRLEETLGTPSGAFGFWLISFAWGWLTMLPHTLAAAHKKTPPLGSGAVAACVLYVLGLATEIAADVQKWQFKQNPANRGKFCDLGVWKVSQHPNYFGNLCLWSAIWCLNAPTLARKAPLALLASTASPLFLAALFFGQSTGLIGPALDLADQKYGHLAGYQAYKAHTPLIVPDLFKLLRALAAMMAVGHSSMSDHYKV